MIKLLHACLILMFFPVLGCAEPFIFDVFGDLSHDQTILLSGTGFGKKSIVPPIKFENFESGTVGESVAAGGFFYINPAASYSDIVYSSSKQRTAFSSLNIRDRLVYSWPVSTPNTWFLARPWKNKGKKFVSMWVYIDMIKSQATADWQLKLWRMTENGYSGTPAVRHQTWWNSTSTGPGANGGYFEQSFAPSKWGFTPLMGRWQLYQVRFQDSDQGIANGTARYRLFKGDGSKANSSNADNIITHLSTDSGSFISDLVLGLYITNNVKYGHEVHTYWDDIYIDDTWARVELGDSAVYENCTMREMQIPIAWSNTGITFKFNQGQFKNGDTAYVFVTDENDSPSIGKQVSVGGTSPPLGKPPTGSVIINNGDETTTSSIVKLSISATDDDGAVPQMQLSQDNSTWSSWERYVTKKNMSLLPGFGERFVYVRFKDTNGNISPVYWDSINVIPKRTR